MNRPFDSFEYLQRGPDVRLLETQSIRSIFVWLLVDLFMLGALSFMMIYRIFCLHHFDWTNAMLLLVIGLPVIRYSRVVYRKLDR